MPLNVDHLVEGAVERAFGRGAVVADDVVDQRVVEDLRAPRARRPAGRHDGRCARGSRHRPPSGARGSASGPRACRPRPGSPRGASVSSASAGMTPSFFCRANVSSRSLSQPWSNLPLYLSAHSLGTWCGACVAPGAKYMKNGLSGISAFCWRDPVDRLVGHVLDEVVALFGRLRRLDRRRALVERRVPLVGLAADEAVEIFEAAAAGRPLVERPDRARLPHRHFVALAELRRRVAVELQGLGERRRVVRQHRACSPAPTSRSR